MEESRTKSVLAAYLDQKGLCPYCQGEITSSNVTVEHIIPRAWGGLNFGRNVVLACEECNNLKSEIETLICQAFDKRMPLTSKAALFLLRASVRFRIHKKETGSFKVRYFRMAHLLLETVDDVESHRAEDIPQIPIKHRAKFL